MKASNFFKVLTVAMLLPAMLLTTGCSKDDVDTDNIGNTDNENTSKGVYTLPVTVRVTRQGDESANSPATRAVYNGDTKKLAFETGDQLYVTGRVFVAAVAKVFYGTLDYVSEGTFSGTITTEFEYSGTADGLFTSASGYGEISAVLLPKDYDKSYEYLSIDNNSVVPSPNNAFALTKAAAVEQFSYEKSTTYNSGFALSPQNAILNFTITGLTASTAASVSLTGSYGFNITKEVTTDESGNATFAVGIDGGTALNSLTLTVNGAAINLGSRTLQAGHIYNITRKAKPATGHPLTVAEVGDIVGSDGLAYAATDYKDLPVGMTAIARVFYMGNETDNTTYTHGLALALADESGVKNWEEAKTAAAAHTPTITGSGVWLLPSSDQWGKMVTGAGGGAALLNGFESVGGTNLSVNYWTSTEHNEDNAYYRSYISLKGRWDFLPYPKTRRFNVRACLVF